MASTSSSSSTSSVSFCCLCGEEALPSALPEHLADQFVPILKAAKIKFVAKPVLACISCHTKTKETVEFFSSIKSTQQKCLECGFVFKSASGRLEHRHSHPSPSLVCEICGRTFHYRRSLKAHLASHDPARPFTCEECGRAFRDRTNLMSHLRTHTELKPFRCSQCPDSFGKRSNLQRHIQRKHSGSSNYKCHCGKSFAVESDLTEHAQTHSLERTHHCRLCDKSFKFANGLRKHMEWHKGEAKHQCSECGRKFRDSGNMLKHVRLHAKKRESVKPAPVESAQLASVIVPPQCSQTRRVIVSPTPWSGRSATQQVIVYNTARPTGQPSQVITYANNSDSGRTQNPTPNIVFGSTDQVMGYQPCISNPKISVPVIQGYQTELLDSEVENLLENFEETREIIVPNVGLERDMYPFDISYL